jgi:hypothetical protein
MVGNGYWARKVTGRMRCYGVASSRSGEISCGKYGKQVCGKREASTFLLVLVARLSYVNWHGGGGFWWGLRRLSPLHRLQPQDVSSHSSCDSPIYRSNSELCPSTPQVLSLLLPSDVLISRAKDVFREATLRGHGSSPSFELTAHPDPGHQSVVVSGQLPKTFHIHGLMA